jgi:hypothetical protein
MDNTQPFFGLTGKEALSIGILCVSIADEIMEHEKEFQLQPELMEAFEALKTKLYAVKTDEPEDIGLTARETFAFQHAFVQCAYRVKGHLLLLPEERKTNEADPEIETIFGLLQDNAPGLFWRITRKLGYNAYGLDTLEKVFNIKTGVVRKLEVDNIEEISTITIDEQNQNALRFSFNLINSLEAFQDESDFIRRIYEHQFMDMTDFREVLPKMVSANRGDIVSLTMRDTIIVYWVVVLIQNMFITDAADIIESIGKEITMESYKKVRSFVLRYYAVLIAEMEKGWKDNPEIMFYFDKVKEWEI